MSEYVATKIQGQCTCYRLAPTPGSALFIPEGTLDGGRAVGRSDHVTGAHGRRLEIFFQDDQDRAYRTLLTGLPLDARQEIEMNMLCPRIPVSGKALARQARANLRRLMAAGRRWAAGQRPGDS